MIFPHTSRRDFDKSRLRAQLLDGFSSTIAHACTQTPDELVEEFVERTLVGNATLYSLGNEFSGAGGIVRLAITLARTMDHGTQRSHPSVGFVCATLVQDALAWTLVQTGKQAPQHDQVCTRSNSFGDIS